MGTNAAEQAKEPAPRRAGATQPPPGRRSSIRHAGAFPVMVTTRSAYATSRREQEPIVTAQVHLIYEFRGGSWLALNANYYANGRTTVEGNVGWFGLSG